VAGDVHHVGVRLRDAGRDGTDSGLGDQLHVDIGVGTRSLQIEDELLEVLDRVDVVLWRRRDEPDTGSGTPDVRDHLVDLLGEEVAALAGLRPCAILICSSSALARYSEVTPNRPDATCLTLLLFGAESLRRLAALARVRLRAEPVHRDRVVLVGFGRDASEAHRGRREALDDRLDRFDLLDRDGVTVGLELQESAQGL